MIITVERSLTKYIKEWYDDAGKRLLIVAGAGGVGKTWLIDRFCSWQSQECIRLDMKEKTCEELRRREAVERLIKYGENVDRIQETEKERLIFADNVNSKEQLEAFHNLLLKLAGDKVLNKLRVIIVGRVVCEKVYRDIFKDILTDEELTYLRLYPMSFSEFTGVLPASYRMDAYNMLKIYMIVGGMPECVSLFIENGDLTKVREKQKKMINNIHFSIGCSDVRLLKKCQEVIRSLPAQPWEGTGFTLRKVNTNARERDYGLAIKLLEDYGIVCRLQRFDGNRKTESKNYKLQLLDVGLYGALSEMNERTIYDEEKLFDKTMVTMFAVQELMAYGINTGWKICYWNGQRIKAKLPIVLGGGNTLVPVELMARENVRSKSLSSFLEKYDASGVVRVLNPLIRGSADKGLQKNKGDIIIKLYQLEELEVQMRK